MQAPPANDMHQQASFELCQDDEALVLYSLVRALRPGPAGSQLATGGYMCILAIGSNGIAV